MTDCKIKIKIATKPLYLKILYLFDNFLKSLSIFNYYRLKIQNGKIYVYYLAKVSQKYDVPRARE